MKKFLMIIFAIIGLLLGAIPILLLLCLPDSVEKITPWYSWVAVVSDSLIYLMPRGEKYIGMQLVFAPILLAVLGLLLGLIVDKSSSSDRFKKQIAVSVSLLFIIFQITSLISILV